MPTEEEVTDLVYANRILAMQGVLDGFGHVSARQLDDPRRFLMSRSLAPALVQRPDIQAYDLDGVPLADDGRAPYLERFIHSAIYAARPDVGAIVHSHSQSLIPFGVTRTPLRPIHHMCGFLGCGSAHFDIRDRAGATDMLVRTAELGRQLAECLGPGSLVLMRGHGSTVVGPSLRHAVYRAVYAEMNARLQLQSQQLGEITFLSEEEAALAEQANASQLARPWALWRDAVGNIG